MVQQAMQYIDEAPTIETRIELIETLNTVSAGKVLFRYPFVAVYILFGGISVNIYRFFVKIIYFDISLMLITDICGDRKSSLNQEASKDTRRARANC